MKKRLISALKSASPAKEDVTGKFNMPNNFY